MQVPSGVEATSTGYTRLRQEWPIPRLRPAEHATGDCVIPLLLHHVGIPIPIDIGTISLEWQVLIGTLIANFCVIRCARLVIPASGRNRVGGCFHLLMRSRTDLCIGSCVIIRSTY